MRYYLAIDIGGTDIKYGIINYDEQLVFNKTRPTNAHLGAHVLIEAVKELYYEYNKEYKIEGIAISTTGGIDEDTNVLFPSVTIPGLDELNFRRDLKELNIPISVENDVNSMALCEKDLVDNHENMKSIIALTIGTGIGGSIFINDKMHKGFQYTAGEWGKIFISDSNDSWEGLASMSALVRNSKKVLPSINNGIDVFNEYDSGNELIIPVVNKFFDNFTKGLANLIYVLNPDHIVIGGGIAARGDKFLKEIYNALEDKIWPYLYDKVSITLAVHKNSAGMIGAFKNFKNTFNI